MEKQNFQILSVLPLQLKCASQVDSQKVPVRLIKPKQIYLPITNISQTQKLEDTQMQIIVQLRNLTEIQKIKCIFQVAVHMEKLLTLILGKVYQPILLVS